MAAEIVETYKPANAGVTVHFAHSHLASIDAACGRADNAMLALLAITVGLIGFFGKPYFNVESTGMSRWIGMVVLCATLVAEFAALYRGVLLPSLHTNRSFVDFRGIVSRTSQQFVGEYPLLGNDALLADLSRQIHERASALTWKHDQLRKAFIAMLATLPAALFAYGVFD